MNEYIDKLRDYHATVDAKIANRAICMTGSVNRSAFAGHPAGTLVLRNISMDRTGIGLTFSRNLTRRWNQVLTSEGWREWADAKGRPAFESVDFTVLDSPGKMIDLVADQEHEQAFAVPFDFETKP